METTTLELQKDIMEKITGELMEKIRNLRFVYPNNLPLSNVIREEEGLQIEKISQEYILKKLETLKKDIGDKLFEALSFEDKIFMLNTADSIDFGHPVDLKQISQEISDYENF